MKNKLKIIFFHFKMNYNQEINYKINYLKNQTILKIHFLVIKVLIIKIIK